MNGSALAVGRTIVAIIENFYENGVGVHIPKVLKDYLDFDLIEEKNNSHIFHITVKTSSCLVIEYRNIEFEVTI